ncbi:MAG: biotin carboxylase N-terminal domain-containing protein [Actinomycetota bacterium]
MTTLLVANRGEVALRVFRTARRLGMRCVALYSEADTGSPFALSADDAIPIGPAPAAESYLRIDRILDAAKQAGADLIHPGYGFLAEDAEFAEACEAEGFAFVGPPPEILRLTGAKDRARAAAVEAGVPIIEGYDGEDQALATLVEQAERIGYPVMVKPAEGGGGKGMAVAHTRFQLERALDAARRIAMSAFGDDRLLIERYLRAARHIEVQIFGNAEGEIFHLGERDCSVQRRHQKILEESPAPNLAPAVRERLWTDAVTFARHVGYRNAGTCEFLVGADGTIAFIELNARLQVEHPVTEMVTDLDLVELQLQTALGEKVDVSFRSQGHAVEARLYAEDPSADFLPQSGEIVRVDWPDGVRIDTGIDPGSRISPDYDPMIAKLIVHGPNREAALESLAQALSSTEVLGIRTNLSLLKEIVDHGVVRDGLATTDWLESSGIEFPPAEEVPEEAVLIAAAAEAGYLLASRASPDPWSSLGPWRPGARGVFQVVLRPQGEERIVEVQGEGPYLAASRAIEVEDPLAGRWLIDGRSARAARGRDAWFVIWEETHYEIPVGHGERRIEESVAAHLDAPLPGQVVAVRVESGESVSKGQELVVVEAMKMEHSVKAPADGLVRAVLCGPGDRVDRGQTLIDFEPA